jgi:CMP-N-acetylneuraminic acid synthetase
MKKNLNEVAILIQARLGSQRVPGKMLKPFAGTTLVNILLDKLRHSDLINPEQVFLSLHEEELKDVAVKYPFNIFNRSEKSAKSEGEPLMEIYEWWDKLPGYKYVVLVSACNPLLKLETIEKFLTEFVESDREGAFAVFQKKTYYWDKEGLPITDWKGSTIMNTKFVEPIYEAAHCLYASRLDIIGQGHWMDTNSPPQPKLVVMEELEALDIDYQWQFEIAEKLYESLR